MKNELLVTVGVITYNSSRYIKEALDSVKNQTYSNIELLISDDCSTDNTVDVIKEWIQDNQETILFPIRLITADKNTGTSGNNNRILCEANGEWLKIIAGDDALPRDSIQNYVEYVLEHDNCYAAFSDELVFLDTINSESISTRRIGLSRIAFGAKATAKDQYRISSKQPIGFGPTFFAKVNLVKEVGGFDERFPLIDDVPLFIKITKHGVKIHYIPKPLVYYRININSVSHQKSDNSYFSKSRVLAIQEYRLEYFKENLSGVWLLLFKMSFFLQNLVIVNGNDVTSFRCRCAITLQKILDPIDWYSRIINHVDKAYKILYKKQ